MSETVDRPKSVVTVFERPKCFLIAGMPGKGKSHMTGYLLQEFLTSPDLPKNERFAFGAVFGDPSSIGEYNWLPKRVLHAVTESKEIDGVFGSYIKNLVAMNEKLNLEKNGPESDSDDEFEKEHQTLLPPNFVVLDDIVGILNSQSKTFNKFITTFRKTNTTVFICVQYINQNVSTTVRQCIEYCIMFDFDNEKTQKALYNAFGNGFSKFQDYKDFIGPMLQKNYHQVQMDHPAVLYMRSEDTNEKRYHRIQAPQYKKVRISFSGRKKKNKKTPTEEQDQVEPRKFSI